MSQLTGGGLKMSRGQAPASTPDHRRRGPLLERLAALLGPVSLRPCWSLFTASKRARAVPENLPQLVSALETEFSVADLKAARVLVPGPQGDWTISPVLREADGCALVVREPDLTHPFDLVTVRGSLVCGAPPALFADRDDDTRRYAQRQDKRMILATTRASDLALLTELRLPVTSMA